MQLVNVGAAPNDGTGDPLRNAFVKINSNLLELSYKVKVFDFAQGLRDDGVQSSMALAVILYETTPGDGSRGLWFWNSTDVRADDVASVIQPMGAANGRWNKLIG
jgi:hypothetical protein